MGIISNGTVAQLQYPSDSIGAPYTNAFGGCVVDWPNMRAFLYNGKGIRSYDISTFGTKSPLLSVAFPHSGVLAGFCICTPDGYVLITSGGDNSGPYCMWRKLDPTTLTTVATWGPAAYPNGMIEPLNRPGSAVATCMCNGVPYALAREITSLKGACFRTDTMKAAGWFDNIASNTGGVTWTMMTGGKSSTAEGTMYSVDYGPRSAIDVRKLTITAGAETWNPISWPTPNPDINLSIIHTLTLSEVNTLFGTSWTQLSVQTIGYDTQDDVLIILIGESPITSPQYFMGMSPSGTILWNTLSPFVATPDLEQNRTADGMFYAVGNGDSVDYGLISGADGTEYPDGFLEVNGLGADYRSYFADSVTQTVLGCVAYTTYPGSVQAAPGTPSTFAGWAMIQAWPIPMDSIEATAAIGDLSTLVQDPPNETMNRLACIQQPIPGDTMVTLQWSDDAGASWSNGIEQSLGELGAYLTTIQFRRLGMARNRVFRVYWSGPMATALTGMMLQFEVAQT